MGQDNSGSSNTTFPFELCSPSPLLLTATPQQTVVHEPDRWEIAYYAPDSVLAMSSNQDEGFWGTLIRPDKSPAPLLERLCLGIAQLMPTIESSRGTQELTPEKLATFYRQTGGKYDELFLENKGPTLSFIYQSLGCFHTLQPTANPYQPPSVPALLPHGFVRWQTIQLLLFPEEHSRFLQNAVSQWDIPSPDGGTFPKTIPREAFPAQPDPEMVEWYERVTRHLEQEYHSRNPSRHSTADSRHYHRSQSRERTPERKQDDYRQAAFSSRRKSASTDDLRTYRGRRRGPNSPQASSPFPHGHDDYITVERRPKGSRTASPCPRTPLNPPTPLKKTGQRQRTHSKGMDSKTRPCPTRHPVSFESSASDASVEDPTHPKRMGASDDRRAYRSYLDPKDILRRHSHDTPSSYRSEYFYERNSSPLPSKRGRESFKYDHPLWSSVRYEASHSFKFPKQPEVKFQEDSLDDSERCSAPRVDASERVQVHSYPPSRKSRKEHRSTRHSVEESLSDHAQPASRTRSPGRHQTESGDSGPDHWRATGIPSHEDWDDRWESSPRHASSRGRAHVYEA